MADAGPRYLDAEQRPAMTQESVLFCESAVAMPPRHSR